MLDKRCWPKGRDGRLSILSGSATDASEKDGIEDGTSDELWQTISGELGSNRCLILGAGKDLSIAIPNIFSTGTASDKTHKEEDAGGGGTGHRKPSEEEGQESNVPTMKSQKDIYTDQANATEMSRTDRARPFTFHLDFRLELDLNALTRDSNDQNSNPPACGGTTGGSPREKKVRIAAWGEYLEIWTTLCLSTPTVESITDGADSTDTNPSREGSNKQVSLSSKVPAISNDAIDGPYSTTWYLQAVSARAGSRAVTLTCSQFDTPGSQQRRRPTLNPENEATSENQGDEREEKEEKEENRNRGGSKPCQVAGEILDLDAWHSLALAVDPESDRVALSLDGDVFPLEYMYHTKSSPAPEENSAPCHATPGLLVRNEDALSIGGAGGGRWVTLAVKNLVVYNTRLENMQLADMTCVFRRLREEKIAATEEEKEANHDLNETGQAEQERKEAGETPVGK